jgi:hypothetical protein
MKKCLLALSCLVAISAHAERPPADAVQFVSTNGNDANDGLSAVVPKATIAAAYAALPPCAIANQREDSGSYTSHRYDHCGHIEVAAGTYTVATTIRITSPFVRISGSDLGSTVIHYTGKAGPAIYWTQEPFSEEFTGSGGLYDIRIDGFNAAAGTSGLQTNDISAFHMRRVSIWNFSQPGSVGWLDSTTHWYNEKYDVELTLKNNATSWEINPGAQSPGYPNTTFGYGNFDVKIETFSGQTGFRMVDGNLAFSMFHMTVNQVSSPANATAISIQDQAQFGPNTYSIEIESPMGVGTGHEISVTSSTPVPFTGVGTLAQDAIESNIWSRYPDFALPTGSAQFWPTFATTQRNSSSPNVVFRLNPCPPGGKCEVIDVLATPSRSYQRLTLPPSTDTLVGRATNDTLQNKILTTPVLSSMQVNSLPAASANPGMILRVSDSTAIVAEGQACTGGSNNNALAFSNGSVWKCF